MAMLTEIRSREVADGCMVCCDGFRDVPEVICVGASCFLDTLPER